MPLPHLCLVSYDLAATTHLRPLLLTVWLRGVLLTVLMAASLSRVIRWAYSPVLSTPSPASRISVK